MPVLSFSGLMIQSQPLIAVSLGLIIGDQISGQQCPVWSRLSQGWYSCTNIMTKKQAEEERDYSAYTSLCCSSPRKSGLELNQVRKQEMMQKPGREVLYWHLPLACSACFLIEPKTTSPEMVPPTRGPSPLITKSKNAPQHGSPGGISPTEAPFSVITPAGVKKTQN